MNFIKRLNRGNFHLSSQSFEIWFFIMGIKVDKKCKILSQYLLNHARDMRCEYQSFKLGFFTTYDIVIYFSKTCLACSGLRFMESFLFQNGCNEVPLDISLNNPNQLKCSTP